MNYRRRLVRRKEMMEKHDERKRQVFELEQRVKEEVRNIKGKESDLKEVYLIGNGHSLKYVNMDLLKDKDTISFNRAYISYEEWGFDPTYYMIIDPALISCIIDDINNLIKTNKNIKRFFIRSMDHKIRKGLPTFDTEKDIIKDERVNLFKTSYKKTFSYHQGIFPYGSVGLCSLQILHKLGYNKVYLLGSDMKYTAELPAVKRTTPFIESLGDEDPNHYRPDYFGKGIKYGHPSNKHIMANWREAYEQIKQIPNFEVISLTPNSDLNEFIPYQESELYDKEYIDSLKKK